MYGYLSTTETAWARLERLSTIYFAKGTWRELDLEEEEKVDHLAQMLKADPDTKATITGHASAEGPGADNQRLAVNRANKVKALLTANGARPGMIDTKGAGSSSPAVRENESNPERLENQRTLNRRVRVAFSFHKVANVNSFIVSRAKKLIDDMIAGKRVVPYPKPDPDPSYPKRGIPDPKQVPRPDEWRALVKAIQDQLEVRGVQIDPEKIAEIIKEALQLPTPDNQGPFDEDYEEDQRNRQSP
jgi:hypothetical protein